MKCFDYRKLSFTPALNGSQRDSWQKKRIYTTKFVMRCDIVTSKGQIDTQWKWWKEIPEGAVQDAYNGGGFLVYKYGILKNRGPTINVS